MVVAAIGDGSDGGTSYTAVSSLIASWNPAQVLTLGDVYEGGSRLEYLNWLGAGRCSAVRADHQSDAGKP